MSYNRLGRMPGEDGRRFSRSGSGGERTGGGEAGRPAPVSRITARWTMSDMTPSASDTSLLRLLRQLANCGLDAASPPLVPIRKTTISTW
jgi:hypothetical protein